MQNQNQDKKKLLTQSKNCEKNCLNNFATNPLQKSILDLALNLPQEIDDDYLPTIKVKSDNDLSLVKAVGTYCKNPTMADSHDILDMLKTLSACLSFGNQHQDEKTALKSYVIYLQNEIYADFIDETLSIIIKNKTFFPSVAEIIEIQNIFAERIRKIRLIARRSCLEYIENQDY